MVPCVRRISLIPTSQNRDMGHTAGTGRKAGLGRLVLAAFRQPDITIALNARTLQVATLIGLTWADSEIAKGNMILPTGFF